MSYSKKVRTVLSGFAAEASMAVAGRALAASAVRAAEVNVATAYGMCFPMARASAAPLSRNRDLRSSLRWIAAHADHEAVDGIVASSCSEALEQLADADAYVRRWNRAAGRAAPDPMDLADVMSDLASFLRDASEKRYELASLS